ncbi:MAG: EI24 domain-containing protein [Desulfobulbaceae bacterium]
MILVRQAARTARSISRAGLIGLMLLCAGLALLVVIALGAGLTWLTANLVSLKWQWLDITINWLVGIMLGVGGWFMLPVFVVIISGAFQERTIHRVERAEYPDKVRSGEPRFWPDVMHDIRFTLKAVFLNLLILPFYFIGIGFLLSVLVNSYLLGREFFESAAGYHVGKPQARQIGRRHRMLLFSSGLALTVLALLPGVNLFAPIIAVVWMVHGYHALPESWQSSVGSRQFGA